jgi:DNA-binding MarR family transcriptional regulator
MADQIELVRDFNRYYTRRLGVLTDSFLGQGRPLAEARLLFEIGDRADLRDLRARLGLDSGYLSRLVRSLETQGLVTVRAHPGDGRVRVASLTAAGIRERSDLDARSRDSVGDLLDRLTPVQRSELISAQQQVRRLVRLASVRIEPVPDDDPAARQCLGAYAAELAVRFPEGYADSTLVRPGETEVFLVAREEDRPVGCVGYCRLSDGAAEVRHLWVSAEARGWGLGRRLLTRLEASAAGRGVAVMRLGTHRSLVEAIALYRSGGYREIPPYDDSPYNQLAFEKLLSSVAGSSGLPDSAR